MKSQIALFIASLAFLYITAAGVASATHTQTLQHLSVPSINLGNINQALHTFAEYCQNGECLPQ